MGIGTGGRVCQVYFNHPAHSAVRDLNIDEDQFNSFGSSYKVDGDANQLMAVLTGFDVNTQPLELLRDQLEMECGMEAHYELWESILEYFSTVVESAVQLITTAAAPAIRLITN
jgi:hypothetical protein